MEGWVGEDLQREDGSGYCCAYDGYLIGRVGVNGVKA